MVALLNRTHNNGKYCSTHFQFANGQEHLKDELVNGVSSDNKTELSGVGQINNFAVIDVGSSTADKTCVESEYMSYVLKVSI